MPTGSAAFIVDDIDFEATAPDFAVASARKFTQKPRLHVIQTMAQSDSGRLFCDDDPGVEIPDLIIYAAR